MEGWRGGEGGKKSRTRASPHRGKLKQPEPLGKSVSPHPGGVAASKLTGVPPLVRRAVVVAVAALGGRTSSAGGGGGSLVAVSSGPLFARMTRNRGTKRCEPGGAGRPRGRSSTRSYRPAVCRRAKEPALEKQQTHERSCGKEPISSNAPSGAGLHQGRSQ